MGGTIFDYDNVNYDIKKTFSHALLLSFLKASVQYHI